jgi:5-methylcytosine-specific restriction endonuclease McrA
VKKHKNVKEYLKQYYIDHPEKFNNKKTKERIALWKKNNKARVKEIQRKWRKKNPHLKRAYDIVHSSKRRAMKRNTGSFTHTEWINLCKQYGNKCLCCNKKKPLTADHVIPLILGGKNTIENIQPLCGPCNSKKHTKTVDFRNIRKVVKVPLECGGGN